MALTVSTEFSTWLDREVARTIEGINFARLTRRDQEKTEAMGYKAAARLHRDLHDRGIKEFDPKEFEALLTKELTKRIGN